MSDEPDALTMAERIRHLRKVTLRLTQAAFAAELGVTRGAVTNWERGGGIDDLYKRKIATRWPMVNIDWLMMGEGEAPAPEPATRGRVERAPRRVASDSAKAAELADHILLRLGLVLNRTMREHDLSRDVDTEAVVATLVRELVREFADREGLQALLEQGENRAHRRDDDRN